ncbi:uncharacterized protein EV420DRAFT_1536226 [Desarmillaria tabescens]|uniref:Uncharacterized protein n=1 Tax=Armillaria tabescens TaxID=1929756 RepID=A0AA39KGV9_ARMTA|nr:uncharacterized protein EV420DRAFT_1536226 [Desarmillaria tabescens]KAK0459504.1 hypothetical protein EV420DRAFT_1536226 [Desarmillaria tabescens]
MAGPNLEIFKFSVYLFVPIWALVHFGDPAWYRNNVLPYKDKLFPPTVQQVWSYLNFMKKMPKPVSRKSLPSKKFYESN